MVSFPWPSGTGTNVLLTNSSWRWHMVSIKKWVTKGETSSLPAFHGLVLRLRLTEIVKSAEFKAMPSPSATSPCCGAHRGLLCSACCWLGRPAGPSLASWLWVEELGGELLKAPGGQTLKTHHPSSFSSHTSCVFLSIRVFYVMF